MSLFNIVKFIHLALPPGLILGDGFLLPEGKKERVLDILQVSAHIHHQFPGYNCVHFKNAQSAMH